MSTKVTLFKHNSPFMNIVLPSGYKIAFTKGDDGKGHFWTKDEELQENLAQYIKQEKGLGVFIDQNEKTIDPQFSSPVEKIKKQAIEEYLRSQAKQVDAGNSTDGPLRVQNSDQLATMKATVVTPAAQESQPKISEVPPVTEASSAPSVKNLQTLLANRGK